MRMNSFCLAFTNDGLIRNALKKNLEKTYQGYSDIKIIEELGITHGAARVDIAVINGSIHGYELKSDIDTLSRLPDQMKIYNAVLDRVTLVVGKNHLHEAIKLVPEWWGIIIAKVVDSGGEVCFCNIREAEENPQQDCTAVAALLWREEALSILEGINHAEGVRSKNRRAVYERLAEVLDICTLRAKVSECLRTRVNWRFEKLHMISGG